MIVPVQHETINPVLAPRVLAAAIAQNVPRWPGRGEPRRVPDVRADLPALVETFHMATAVVTGRLRRLVGAEVRAPAAPNQAQHRIASTNQHPNSTSTEWGMSRGAWQVV